MLHVISEMGAGGAEALVSGMVGEGGGFGWESAVASGGGFRADRLRAQGFPTFTVPVPNRRSLGVLRAAAKTAEAIRRFNPDVVLAHNVSASVVTRLAMVRAGRRPVLTVFHGVADADFPRAVRIMRRTSDAVVAVSTATADRLRVVGMTAPDPVVIANAVFPERASTDRATVRRSLGVADDRPVALCLARMEPQKRHDVLLDAWARLGGDAVLWLAGDGSMRDSLEGQATELGLGGRVRFLGSRSDVPDLLAAADVTVLTSDWEGMPIAVLESLAAGRPVVASDVDGVREALAHGGGITVPPGQPEATADALRTLLFDPAARAAAGTAGQAAGRDPHELMKSYDELVRTLVGERL